VQYLDREGALCHSPLAGTKCSINSATSVNEIEGKHSNNTKNKRVKLNSNNSVTIGRINYFGTSYPNRVDNPAITTRVKLSPVREPNSDKLPDSLLNPENEKFNQKDRLGTEDTSGTKSIKPNEGEPLQKVSTSTMDLSAIFPHSPKVLVQGRAKMPTLLEEYTDVKEMRHQKKNR